MNRKEQFLEGAELKGFYNEKLVPFLEGAKWADQNYVVNIDKELIKRSYAIISNIITGRYYTQGEVNKLLFDLREFLK